MPAQTITSVCRLPLPFNADQLQTDVANLTPSDWQSHFNNAIYQGDWSVAPLRAVPGSHTAIYSDPNADTWADTELLGRCPHFQTALAQFACPLLSVRLLRLAPGAVIKEHRDHGLGLDVGEVRLHLVVSTHPKVECRINGASYHWAAGECWYADFGLPHFFANRGDTERVHLVLDCKVNAWLLHILESADAVAANTDILPPSPTTLDWLFEQIQNDPALHKQLFAITNPDDFVAALATFASNAGQAANKTEWQDIMRQNHRAWIERNLP